VPDQAGQGFLRQPGVPPSAREGPAGSPPSHDVLGSVHSVHPSALWSRLAVLAVSSSGVRLLLVLVVLVTPDVPTSAARQPSPSGRLMTAGSSAAGCSRASRSRAKGEHYILTTAA